MLSKRVYWVFGLRLAITIITECIAGGVVYYRMYKIMADDIQRCKHNQTTECSWMTQVCYIGANFNFITSLLTTCIWAICFCYCWGIRRERGHFVGIILVIFSVGRDIMMIGFIADGLLFHTERTYGTLIIPDFTCNYTYAIFGIQCCWLLIYLVWFIIWSIGWLRHRYCFYQSLPQFTTPMITETKELEYPHGAVPGPPEVPQATSAKPSEVSHNITGGLISVSELSFPPDISLPGEVITANMEMTLL